MTPTTLCRRLVLYHQEMYSIHSMAEDQEGLQPQEYIVKNPEAIKTGVRERARGVLDWFIDKNPIVKANRDVLERMNHALPDGRLRAIHRLATDLIKGPMAMASIGMETVKTIVPIVRVAAFPVEMAATIGGKVGGFIVEKAVASRPARFAVGTVEGIMDKILGRRLTAPEMPPATIDNARQILVGMAKPPKV